MFDRAQLVLGRQRTMQRTTLAFVLVLLRATSAAAQAGDTAPSPPPSTPPVAPNAPTTPSLPVPTQPSTSTAPEPSPLEKKIDADAKRSDRLINDVREARKKNTLSSKQATSLQQRINSWATLLVSLRARASDLA